MHQGNKITLIVGISLAEEEKDEAAHKQSHERFGAFISLLQREATHIQCIKLIETSHLHRFNTRLDAILVKYQKLQNQSPHLLPKLTLESQEQEVADQCAEEKGDRWKKINFSAICEQLQSYNISVEMYSLGRDWYHANKMIALNKIQEMHTLYESDTAYQEIVNKLAQEKTDRKIKQLKKRYGKAHPIIKQAQDSDIYKAYYAVIEKFSRDYLLEESATTAFFTGLSETSVLTYPNQKTPNPVFDYELKRSYPEKIYYIPYGLKEEEESIQESIQESILSEISENLKKVLLTSLKTKELDYKQQEIILQYLSKMAFIEYGKMQPLNFKLFQNVLKEIQTFAAKEPIKLSVYTVLKSLFHTFLSIQDSKIITLHERSMLFQMHFQVIQQYAVEDIPRQKIDLESTCIQYFKKEYLTYQITPEEMDDVLRTLVNSLASLETIQAINIAETILTRCLEILEGGTEQALKVAMLEKFIVCLLEEKRLNLTSKKEGIHRALVKLLEIIKFSFIPNTNPINLDTILQVTIENKEKLNVTYVIPLVVANFKQYFTVSSSKKINEVLCTLTQFVAALETNLEKTVLQDTLYACLTELEENQSIQPQHKVDMFTKFVISLLEEKTAKTMDIHFSEDTERYRILHKALTCLINTIETDYKLSSENQKSIKELTSAVLKVSQDLEKQISDLYDTLSQLLQAVGASVSNQDKASYNLRSHSPGSIFRAFSPPKIIKLPFFQKNYRHDPSIGPLNSDRQEHGKNVSQNSVI